jgi:predicted dehydrogenase
VSSDAVGIVVMGVGRWGVHLLRNFLQHPRSQVVAVVDTRPDRLDALRSQLELDGVVLTHDWQAAMQLAGVAAVAIATPAATHYELIQAALKQEHHVLAEKPLTLDWQRSLELCQLAQQQQRQLVVDHTYLFHPAVQQGKTQIQRLGNLQYGYAARTHLGPVRQDVDALWDLAIHDLAIFNHWLGETPQQVQAQGTVWLQPDFKGNVWLQPDFNCSHLQFPQGLSDLVWVKLTYPSGFQATIHLCWCNPDKQRRLCVVGSQGALIFDEMLSASPLVFQQGGIEAVGQEWIPAHLDRVVLPIESTEPLKQVCDHFLDCVQHNSPSQISSGWVGADLVKTLAALTRSLNSGGQPETIN